MPSGHYDFANASQPPVNGLVPGGVIAGSESLPKGSARQTVDTGRVLELALPAVGEQVLNMMVGLVDSYLVGHLGAVALSSVGLANQYVMLATALFGAVGTGATALIARHVGAQEPRMANRILHQSLLMGAAIGLVAAAILFALATTCMEALNAPAEVVEPAAGYLRITCVSLPISAIMFLGMAALRGSGDTRTPMATMAAVNVINVVVAYAFIYGFGPIPALGVAGSAIGAAAGRVTGGILIIGILMAGRAGLRLRLEQLIPDRQQALRILNIGLPAAIEMLFMRVGQMSYVAVVAGLGTVAFAAHQLALTSESISYMPGFGFAVAATTLVGQGLGAREPDRAQSGGYESLRMAMVAMTLMGLVFVFFAPQLLGIFTSDPLVIEQGEWPLRLVGLSQPMLSSAMVLSGGLRGAGDTRKTLVITAVGFWGVRLPLALLLTGPFGLIGAWIAMSVDLNARGLAMLFRFRSGKWKTLRV